jgi:hypothetical protein
MQPEGTYSVNVGGYNELDGWVFTEPTTFEVLARCGPIIIDDFALIKDKVTKETRNTVGCYEFWITFWWSHAGRKLTELATYK